MQIPSDLSLETLLKEPPAFQPTLEQEAILEAGKKSNKSLMLRAMAGCSKSTTLELLARSLPPLSTCYVVFAKKNQLEAEKKWALSDSPLSKFGSASHVKVLTANGLGHGAWSRAIGKRLILDTKKIFNLTKNSIPRGADQGDFVAVMQLVNKARLSGLVPKERPSIRGILPDTWDSWELLADSLYLELNEELLYAARKVLAESIRLSYLGQIDFDDQIYMSALFGGVFPRFQVTMLDEAQDLSPLNHIQIKRTASDRLIVVGDPRQAIYAFRGADSSSMDTLRTLRDEWVDLPLSVTFRCPKVVVSRQQRHAPGFSAHSSNQEGTVTNLQGREWDASIFKGKVAILCRNNAPLFACALRIIKSGEGCTILGKEIGKSLVAYSKKIVPDDGTGVSDALQLIQAHTQAEISKALANGKDERVAILHDKEDCLKAIFENSEAKTMGAVRSILSSMFSSENLRITLATGHKAKGLEWPTVVHLDPWRIPSKFAKNSLDQGNPVPMEQDLNLRYVIETRAQKHLILANLENMK